MLNRDVLTALAGMEARIIGRLETLIGGKTDQLNQKIDGELKKLYAENERLAVALSRAESERDQRGNALMTPRVAATLTRVGNGLPHDVKLAMRLKATEMLARGEDENAVCDAIINGASGPDITRALVDL